MTILTQSKALSTATIKAAQLRRDFGDKIQTIRKDDKYQVVFLGSVEEYQSTLVESVWG